MVGPCSKRCWGGAWTYYQGGDVVDCVLGAAVTSVLCAMEAMEEMVLTGIKI